MKKTIYKPLVFVPSLLIIIFLILMIPVQDDIQVKRPGESVPFIWDQDNRWESLESSFTQALREEDEVLKQRIDSLNKEADKIYLQLNGTEIRPGSEELKNLLDLFFETGSYVAAFPEETTGFLDRYSRYRRLVKKASVSWDIEDRKSRDALYKYLYGMRAAAEEVLLQSESPIDPVLYVDEVASETPSTDILGIEVHSGDLLVSRGGAEVSALISRGNDFPGNFSHVALIYIEEGTNIPYLVEAHIERGVAIATLEEYLRDRKLRFMVLRPRPDLPEIMEDPMIPHKAAKLMFEEVQNRHIPYDFKMDFYDEEAMFCSEVGSYAYASEGITLWQAESTISSDGIVRLLKTFGVENFVTQMPSDLEYDPQLSVVAEWRDTESLMEDHVYNAVIDAMLVCAGQGKEVDYNAWYLPLARVLKGYSMILNLFENHGPVPEGMSATQALKNNSFVDEHATYKEEVYSKVESFKKERGYNPPYWELVKMAENTTSCSEN
ncbi:YiiX/YebB-like N1pC/P60 family cysteine hydrolase [Balneola sp. MJW-20]|uniref:YiiX/YebB-like N1pC/P60 family cysteine hydrolase n=1 Tax=Gracilimonas aurantiaca TaxID=3234185 RepID=UPI003465D091